MQNIIGQMLEKYNTNTLEDKKNAFKEVVQEIVLCGLSRAGFFKEAAFYGGTALRIFYGLDRFSEDLDFSLLSPNLNFDIQKYFSILSKEINSLGLEFSIEEKAKSKESNIKSAFLKGNTKEHIVTVYSNEEDGIKISSNEIIKIKFEVDINPPSFATYENKFGLMPYPYQVKMYDLPSLFAGKLHAVICRSWKSRIKGRDLYDYIFYLSKGAKVNIEHLKARLVQTNFIDECFNLNRDSLIEILKDRFSRIDYNQAKEDVLPFIKDKSKLDIWSEEFFIAISEEMLF